MTTPPPDPEPTGRYTPSERPGEWVCSDCTPPTGQRVSNRAVHDSWHLGFRVTPVPPPARR